MGTSSKTTIMGIIAAIVFAIPGLQQLIEQGLTSGNWKEVGAKILSGIVIGLIGFFAKDYNVTGGVVQNPESSKTTKGAIDVPPVAIPPAKEG